MSDDCAFVDALMADPDNDVLRLVYADWLEERGDVRGEFLRLEVELAALTPQDTGYHARQDRLQQLRGIIDKDWRARLGKSPVELCGLEWAFQCPRQWDKLEPTEASGVRFCEACREQVYYCHSIEEAQAHAWQGHCVAVDAGVPRREGDLNPPTLMAGLIALPTLPVPARTTRVRPSRRTQVNRGKRGDSGRS